MSARISAGFAAVAGHDYRVWALFFVYAAAAAAAVQFVLLPVVAPGMHDGHGLFADLDAVSVHAAAAARADLIAREGWAAWRQGTGGGLLVSLTSAGYAAILPEPWIFIPANAALHASAAFLLFRMIGSLTDRRSIALVSAVPFLVYPSTLSWYAQLSDNGWFVLGIMLFLYGWMRLFRPDGWTASTPWTAPACVLAGSVLAALARPYASLLLEAFSIAFVAALTIVAAYRASRTTLPWRMAARAAVIAVLVTGAGRLLANQNSTQAWMPQSPGAPPPSVAALADEVRAGQTDPGVDPESRARLIAPTAAGIAWENVSWLPAAVNARLFGLADWRDRFRTTNPASGSNIDLDVGFRGGSDVIAYLPRAAVVGLFAPFPDEWLAPGRRSGGTLMRRVTAFEMIGIYAGLVFVPLAVWHWRARVELYLMAVFCLGAITVFSLVVTNVGALYRFRYPFIMTLAGVGLAALFSVVVRNPGHGR